MLDGQHDSVALQLLYAEQFRTQQLSILVAPKRGTRACRECKRIDYYGTILVMMGGKT